MRKSTTVGFKKHLHNLLEGAANVLVIFPEQDYIKPQKGDFRKDAKNLVGDMRMVGNDLRKELDKDVKNYAS